MTVIISFGDRNCQYRPSLTNLLWRVLLRYQGFVGNFLKMALGEDCPAGDITTQAVLGRISAQGTARFVAKQDLVVSGWWAVRTLLKGTYSSIKLTVKKKDGAKVKKGEVIATMRGPLHKILILERTALNVLQNLSGVATLTGQFVKVAGKRVKILDTRKTLPGYREWQKRAVRDGGGHNHRMSLSDQYLVKDNHIDGVGGIARAMERVMAHRQKLSKKPKVEVEVRDLLELKTALAYKPHIVLLDNMKPAQVKKAIQVRNKLSPKTQLEVSGGITLKNLNKYVGLGVDRISVGALTHSAPAADISLLVE